MAGYPPKPIPLSEPIPGFPVADGADSSASIQKPGVPAGSRLLLPRMSHGIGIAYARGALAFVPILEVFHYI